MKPASSVKFSYADLRNFPDDGRRHEIIDGEHYVTPSPVTKHQRIVRKLGFALSAVADASRLGEVFLAPFDVVLSEVDAVQPDVLYVSRGRDIVTGLHVEGAPDLVVEILSAGTRRTDEVTKRKLYERFGVLEYWIVDPELDTIKICRRVNEAFIQVAELSAERGDVLTTPLLPAFSLPLPGIFAEPSGDRYHG